MRVAVAASELPHPQGTAAGRDLFAWCEGMRALGHDVEAWVWYRSPSSPEGPVPDWCRYEPFDPGSPLLSHLRALLVPRNDLARAGWRPDPDAVAVADHLPSLGAVVGLPRAVATLHFRAMADALAIRRVTPPDVQMARAERRAGRRAALVLAYSHRVGRHLRRAPAVVPLAHPIPPEAVAPVEAPVAAVLADWSWPPNQVALRALLTAWPGIRAAVPGATLLLAGRNLDRMGVGTMAGVEALGPVGSSSDVLSRTAVVTFPCPPSSGPKAKVVEALAHGVPVVTTPAGVEGIVLGPDAAPMVCPAAHFADRVSALLRDPEQRARLGALGRDAVAAHHSPAAAAQARAVAFRAAFGVT